MVVDHSSGSSYAWVPGDSSWYDTGVFRSCEGGDVGQYHSVVGRIYQALVTTVAGLIVGILALFAYNYLTSRLNRVMNSMESKTMEFMDLLNEPA